MTIVRPPVPEQLPRDQYRAVGPLPGMVKVRCQACRFWLAAPDAEAQRCPDCAIRLRRPCSRSMAAA
jgi:hypothetical protein